MVWRCLCEYEFLLLLLFKIVVVMDKEITTRVQTRDRSLSHDFIVDLQGPGSVPEEAGADPGHAGETISLGWPENTLVFPRTS